MSELMHYGVLGMKWGVRRTPEQLGRKRIKAGTNMYRVSVSKDGISGNGPTYVTYLKVDRDKYKGTLNYRIKDWQGSDGKTYEHKMKLTKDLNIPSLKEVREIEDQIVKNKDIQALIETSKSAQLNSVSNRTNIPAKKLAELYDVWLGEKKASDVELAKTHGEKWVKRNSKDLAEMTLDYARELYDDPKGHDFNFKFEASLGGSEYNKNLIINELKKRGYNAMYDNASIGVESGIRAEGVESLLIFDSSVLQEVKSTEITDKMSNASHKRYMNWYNKVR